MNLISSHLHFTKTIIILRINQLISLLRFLTLFQFQFYLHSTIVYQFLSPTSPAETTLAVPNMLLRELNLWPRPFSYIFTQNISHSGCAVCLWLSRIEFIQVHSHHREGIRIHITYLAPKIQPLAIHILYVQSTIVYSPLCKRILLRSSLFHHINNIFN